MKPRLSIIAAMAQNRVIGIDNKLPWRLPADLAYFKSLTVGHHMIMGRKTYQSLPGGKPLPGRVSVIVTRDPAFSAPGCVVVHSLSEAIAACVGDEEAFFIGGAEIYRQALTVADRIYLTEVRADVPGDARFPEFELSVWRETTRTECLADERNALAYDFVVYDRYVA
jgi:dihydrofolate reductase